MPTTIHPKATRRLMALVQKARDLGSPQPHDARNAREETFWDQYGVDFASDAPGFVEDSPEDAAWFNRPVLTRGYQLTAEQGRQIQAFIDSQTACAKIEIFSSEGADSLILDVEPDCVHWEDAHNPAPQTFCGIKVGVDAAIPVAGWAAHWDADELPPAPKRASKRLGIKIAKACRENDLRVGQLLANAACDHWGGEVRDSFNLPDEVLRDYINDLEGKRKARIFEETVAGLDTDENRGI